VTLERDSSCFHTQKLYNNVSSSFAYGLDKIGEPGRRTVSLRRVIDALMGATLVLRTREGLSVELA